MLSQLNVKHRCIFKSRSVALVFAMLSIFMSFSIKAQAQSTEPQSHEVIQIQQLQGRPFAAIPSADGQWLFVTLSASNSWERMLGANNGVAVLRKIGDKFSFMRFVPTSGTPFGLVQTHDGKLIIVAAITHVAFLDTARLINGEKDVVIGSMTTADQPGTFTVNVTQDDHFLFVAEENSKKITVVDLEKARATGFKADAIVGSIPVGHAPIALAFSPDQHYLYTTSQRVGKEMNWPDECASEGHAGEKDSTPMFPQGAVVIIDVERAKKNPENAVIAQAPAGCNAVRLVLSHKGDLAYVTARKDNEVLVLDTAKMVSDPRHAKLGSLYVGQSPVGIAVDKSGLRLYVTSSNRFATNINAPQFVTVIDSSKSREGKLIPLGRVPANIFPRELAVTPDQGTLIITNFLSRTVELVDLSKVHLEPLASP